MSYKLKRDKNPWRLRGEMSLADHLRKEQKEQFETKGMYSFGTLGRPVRRFNQRDDFRSSETNSPVHDSSPVDDFFQRESRESKSTSRYGGSPSKRSQRRRDHRGSRSRKQNEPVNCFSCGDAGHIAKTCPRKSATNTPGSSPAKKAEMSSSEDRIKSIESNNLSSEKEKRDAYYGAFNYNFSTEKNQALQDDVFSRKLDECLKIEDNLENGWLNDIKVEKPPNEFNFASSNKFYENPVKTPVTPVNRLARPSCGFVSPVAASPQKTEESCQYQTIETRRKLTKGNGVEVEEWTYIRFPNTLPQNVKVIAAHLLPAPLC